MTWNNPETKLKFTTYPMIHVGDAIYYERVSADLLRCEYVLLEGISWRLGDKRYPLYDLMAKNLGKVAQAKALKLPPSATRVNIDMKRSEFRRAFSGAFAASFGIVSWPWLMLPDTSMTATIAMVGGRFFVSKVTGRAFWMGVSE